MKEKRDFYSFSKDEKIKALIIENSNFNEYIDFSEGMCGEIFLFYQGINCYPRYVCAKVPKKLPKVSSSDTAYHSQVKSIINHYRNEIAPITLEEISPYLSGKWEWLKSNFKSNIF